MAADMTDKTEQPEQGEKPAAADKPEKAAKAPKGEKAAKAGKKAKGGEGAEAKGKGGERAGGGQVDGPGPYPRLRKQYDEKAVPELVKTFGYKNRMQVPRLEKIVVNMGVGEANANPKLLDAAVVEMTQIVGQKPAVRRAKKSIANFKLREGQAIGCAVTLRGNRMWEFYDRLVSVALPRIRDFRGVLQRSFDGRGNYTMGVTEQIVFPEIDYDKVEKIRGMDITIVTSARTDEEGRELLRLMNMPFRAR
jgi:large subunit ribosomal protein L5